VVWEAFFTSGEATFYGDSPALTALSGRAAEGACCAPPLPAAAAGNGCCDAETPQGVCCPPKSDLPADAPCCG
jgi:hypothetical protein